MNVNKHVNLNLNMHLVAFELMILVRVGEVFIAPNIYYDESRQCSKK